MWLGIPKSLDAPHLDDNFTNYASATTKINITNLKKYTK